jgi:hypothetical protein
MTSSRSCVPQIAALVFASSFLALPAQAAPVSITGGFSSMTFSVNPSATDHIVNGVIVPFTSGDVTATANLSPPVTEIVFGVSQLGITYPTNRIQFSAGGGDVDVGAEFLLGTFTLENGTWTEFAEFSFRLQTGSTDSRLAGHVFEDTLRFQVTPTDPGNTPEQNADYFFFTGNPGLGSMRVYETFDSPTGSNTGTIELYGRIGSLNPTRLDNATGGAFLYAGIGPIPPTAVPLPGGLLLLSSALAALAIMRRNAG